ncbi:hypothetical protein [Curtobacterium sp. VKM Ac-1376]|uniref:hypothetical protein n=1 Tax=Curtobacterium sp. VKM Ac-1376 TaxID=123312 RepID=UPI00188D2D32|nr:hypothetical protein [Curtobacterium sp. VKM Ac-1376]MBF4613784.1 hypothetical protein [Curtobacterium sp. VKM Ac-1376]
MVDDSATHAEKYGEIRDGVLQLRFADETNSVHAINAAEVADVLQGLVEFTSDMAKQGLFGDGMPPEVRVRPVKEGSFVVEALIQWAAENPDAAAAISGTVGGVVTKAFDIGLKKLRGDEPTDIEYLDNGNVKLQWPGSGVNEVPRSVWQRLNTMKRPTRTALRKMMAPLSDEADRMELRDGEVDQPTAELMAAAPDAVATRSEYREAAAEVDEVSEEVETFTAEAKLQSIDFRPGQKWRVQTASATRLATIEDEDFLRGLDEGTSLHKNDIFQVTIREVRTITNGRTTTDWSLVNAERTRRGTDDGDALAPRAS